MEKQELTPPYVRYLARAIRPFPNWDFFFIKSVRKRAVEALQLQAGGRVLDAGCGTGGTFPHLIQAVGPLGEVVGVEISPEAAINARRRVEANHWNNVDIVVGDASTVQLAGKFDGLVMFAAPDLYGSPEVIANLFPYLTPAARVVIFGPKHSNRRLGALPNLILRMLMKLSFTTTPRLDDSPLSAIENRIVRVQMQEYLLGCMFLACGSVAPHDG